MKALVVGYGSIGSRHARLLRDLGFDVAVVSRRAIDHTPCYATLSSALKAQQPEYVVIAARTHEHAATMEALVAGAFRGVVLVEKPLYETPRVLPRHGFKNLYVAYNLRFHPVIQAVRECLRGQRVISAHAYVGQYLPHWRPGADYRQSYSARRAEGGGVLRDLSHELDYVQWLLGPWRSLAATGGHYSSLEIDSDDVFALQMVTARCPVVTVNMNYLDRTGQRRLVIHTDAHTLRADLMAGTLEVDGDLRRFEVGRDETYVRQHRAVLAGDGSTLCSAEEGLEVVRLIDAAERAAAGKIWVSNADAGSAFAA
jgi:predicted dehydrogenase